MNYEIKVAIASSDDHNFIVNERSTHQFIKRFKTKDDAKKLLRHLNMGGGFDGWTPAFMLQEIKLPTFSDNY